MGIFSLLSEPFEFSLDKLFNSASQALVFDGVCADYVTRVFRQAGDDLGIADFRFHDLRHTAASWMRMSGADIHTVALALGHKDLRMTMRYSHLSPALGGKQ
jgi:integrase